MTKRLLTLLPILIALSAAAAFAWWSAAGSGSASASVGNLNAPTNVVATATAGSGTVPVSWTASSTSGGAVTSQGYYVTRVRNSDSTTVAACGSPTSLVTGTSCSNANVPDGIYHYVVTAVYRTWTATSAASNNVTVVNDSAAPSVALTFPTNGSSYNLVNYGGTCFPVGICGTATDSTGVASVQVSIKRVSDGFYWNGSGFVNSGSELFNSAGLLSPNSTSTGWDYAFARPADGSYTVDVRATDTLGNAPASGLYSATATFTVDTVAPAVTLTAPANNTSSANTAPTFSGAAGTASGDLTGITVKIYSGSTTGGTLLRTLTTTASAGAWSVAAGAALADGTYTAQASQSDSAGSIGSSSANTFIVDATPPSAAYTFPASGGFYGTTTWNAGCPTAGFCGTASDATSGLASVQIQIKNASGNAWDGSTFRTGNRLVNATVSAGSWSYGFNASSFAVDGLYTVNGTVTDKVGLTSTLATRSFTIDRTGPTVTLTAPVNGSVTKIVAPTFSGAAGTASGDLAAITVKIYSGSSATGTPVQTLSSNAVSGAWSVAASSSLAEGTYTAQASQSDSAGNTANSSASTFTVDTTGPVVTVTVPAAGSTTANQTRTISGAAGNVTGDLTAITVKVYNGSGTGGTVAQTLSATASAGTWSATPSTLAAGTYTVQASQSDTAGNVGTSGAVTFTVNISAPTIGSKPAVKSASTTAAFTFSHTVYTAFQCKLDAGAFAACNSGTVSYSSLSNGSHTFTVGALDAQSVTTSVATYSWTVDTSAPTISANPANPSASAAPSFTFSDTNYTSFECNLDGAGFSGCTSPKSYTGLLDGSHTFKVRAVDADGVATGNASYTWTINTAAPTISSGPTTPSANKTPAFSFSATGYTSFQCKIDAGAFAACTSGSAIATQADGTHTFFVRALDGNSNPTAAASFLWTINTIAPGITSVSGMTAGNTYAATSAAFNFSHSVYTSFQCFLDANTSAACANGKTFSALTEGLHILTANALDSSNVATSNATFSWTVKHAAPTITAQPANPTNTTTATFNFNETPYTLFQCQLDGGTFTACNTGTQSYPGLSGGPAATGVSHTFSVHALDSLNASTAEQTVTWTVDTVAPTGVTATTCSATGSANNRLFTDGSGGAGNATTDSPNITVKLFSGTGTGGTLLQTYTQSRSGATWTITGATSPKLTVGSTYTIQASQSDTAGSTTVGTTVCTFTA